LTFPRPLIIVNRLSSRLVVMTGAQSGSRFISFWRRVRAAWQADRRSTTASDVSPRVLYDCLFRCGPRAKHLECLQISTAHRPSRPGPKISPGAQKKPLSLLPRRRHGVRPEPPATGVRSRSRVRGTSHIQPKRAQSPRQQVCGADPESGAHHTYSPNHNQLLPQSGDK